MYLKNKILYLGSSKEMRFTYLNTLTAGVLFYILTIN